MAGVPFPRAGLTAIVLAILLAGCASPSAPHARVDGRPRADPLGSTDEPGTPLHATSTTGILRGVVVDSAVRPLAGVEVRIQGQGVDRNATTAANGRFGFDLLLAGSYGVDVQRTGYQAQHLQVDVAAGVEDPAYVRFLLAGNGSYLAPYSIERVVEGFIECTGNPMALCGIPNNYEPTACSTNPALCYGNLTNDATLFWLDFDGNTSLLQAELVWDATSPLTQQLSWNHVAGAGCAGVDGSNNVTHGPSPLLAPMTDPVLRPIGGPPCVLYVGITAGPLDEAACLPVQVPLFNTLCFGAAFEQRFTVYAHAFYGYLPPAGWRFTADGDIPPPA